MSSGVLPAEFLALGESFPTRGTEHAGRGLRGQLSAAREADLAVLITAAGRPAGKRVAGEILAVLGRVLVPDVGRLAGEKAALDRRLVLERRADLVMVVALAG